MILAFEFRRTVNVLPGLPPTFTAVAVEVTFNSRSVCCRFTARSNELTCQIAGPPLVCDEATDARLRGNIAKRVNDRKVFIIELDVDLTS